MRTLRLLVPALLALGAIAYVSAPTIASPPPWTLERYYTNETWHAFADIGNKSAGPDDVYAAQQSLKTLERARGRRRQWVWRESPRPPYVYFHWTATLDGGTLDARERHRPQEHHDDLSHHGWHRTIRRRPGNRHPHRRRQPRHARNRALRKLKKRVTRGAVMYARFATFQGDPDKLDQAIESVSGRVAAAPAPGTPGREDADAGRPLRATGNGHGITMYVSEQAMMRGHEALDAMEGSGGMRVGVEFFEVPVHKLGPTASGTRFRGDGTFAHATMTDRAEQGVGGASMRRSPSWWQRGWRCTARVSVARSPSGSPPACGCRPTSCSSERMHADHPSSDSRSESTAST